MKETFMEYVTENNVFPTMEDFLKMHQDKNSYTLFVIKFVKRVVGEARWRDNYFRKPLSEYCTPGDEAFALLTIENNYDRWSAMALSGDHANKN
jgi:hypothetical protein